MQSWWRRLCLVIRRRFRGKSQDLGLEMEHLVAKRYGDAVFLVRMLLWLKYISISRPHHNFAETLSWFEYVRPNALGLQIMADPLSCIIQP